MPIFNGLFLYLMKKCNLFYLFFLVFFQTLAQSISGLVVNEKGIPISNALVYFDGTTFGTTTDEQGKFTIKYENYINPTLVASFPGCETIYLSDFFEGIKIRLWPAKANEFKENKIKPFDRNTALKVFKNQFLGTTEGAKKCVILNEEAIKFAYDNKNYVLYAFSNERLKIQNNHLGYEIDFELLEFYALFNDKTSRQDALNRAHFSGTSFFKEIVNPDINFLRNRDFSFFGSRKHFFRNMVEKRWGVNDFVLLDSNFRINPDDVFDIKKGDETFEVELIEHVKQGRGANLTASSYKSFNLIYNDKRLSTIVLRTKKFEVDRFGNHSKSEYIELSGEVNKNLFANYLPLNFVVEY